MFSFDYSVRTSSRARHVRIVVSPAGEVEVVLPHGIGHHEAPKLLHRERQWVERAVERMRRRAPLPINRGLPQRVALACTGEELSVRYRQVEDSRLSLREAEGELAVTGPLADEARVRTALHNWLKRRARQQLLPQLEALSRQTGLHYYSAAVRLQKSRWGSCSAKRHISLNAKLLFLPPALARHVMLHELVHLEVPNHSRRFWLRLQMLDGESHLHRRQLKEAMQTVPGWAR